MRIQREMRSSAAGDRGSRAAAANPARSAFQRDGAGRAGRHAANVVTSQVVRPHALPISLATVSLAGGHERGDHRQQREAATGRPAQAARPTRRGRCWRWRCPGHGDRRAFRDAEQRLAPMAEPRRDRRGRETPRRAAPSPAPAPANITTPMHGAGDRAGRRHRARAPARRTRRRR